MTCKSKPIPVKSGKYNLQTGIQDSYLEHTELEDEFPIFGSDVNYGSSYDTITRLEIQDNISQQILVNKSYFLSSQVYLYSEAVKNPKWTEMVRCAGFEGNFTDSGSYLLTPTERPESLSGSFNNDGLAYPFVGGKANFSLNSTVGKPVIMQFNLNAIPEDRLISSPIARRSIVDIPLLKNINFTITTTDGDVLTPPLASFTIDNNRNLRKLVEMYKRGSISRILLENPIDPSWSCTVEVDRIFDYSSLVDKRIKCNLEMTVGSLKFTSEMAMLSAAPTFGANNGISYQDLRFKLQNKKKYLMIECL